MYRAILSACALNQSTSYRMVGDETILLVRVWRWRHSSMLLRIGGGFSIAFRRLRSVKTMVKISRSDFSNFRNEASATYNSDGFSIASNRKA